MGINALILVVVFWSVCGIFQDVFDIFKDSRIVFELQYGIKFVSDTFVDIVICIMGISRYVWNCMDDPHDWFGCRAWLSKGAISDLWGKMMGVASIATSRIWSHGYAPGYFILTSIILVRKRTCLFPDLRNVPLCLCLEIRCLPWRSLRLWNRLDLVECHDFADIHVAHEHCELFPVPYFATCSLAVMLGILVLRIRRRRRPKIATIVLLHTHVCNPFTCGSSDHSLWGSV